MDKENNNKLKKYKKKLTTKGRIDLSKGGRVGYAKGKNVRDLRDPSGKTFLDLKDVPDMKVGNQQSKNTQPAPPIKNRAAPTTFTQSPLESKRPDVVQPKETFIENLDNAAKNINTTFTQSPLESKRPDVVQPKETFEENLNNAEQNIKTTFQRGPVEQERKREDILFTDRYNTTDERNEPDENEEDIINLPGSNQGQTPNVGDTYTLPNGNVLVWNGTSYVLQTKETTDEETRDNAVTGSQEQFESERAKRMTQTGRTAEDIAAGTIPEGILPEQELVSVKEGEEYDVEIIELAKRKGVSPEYVKEVGPETVQQMENISTIKTPEPVTASKINEKTVAEEVEVNVARGEVRDEALAKAVGVEKIATVEGVEVEVEPGALANRVVGVLSEEAKSTAAQVAGTSLPRITRAKKQLRNAGLSEEDIAELGSDPEALEARLTDFTEEQRGVIEGLPEEALVSNQLDSLLSGMENGEIPAWARPAVSQVEQMLAKRGMSASTVGRDSLFNAIIQSAVPLAQSNAKAIQQSVGQQKSIEAQVEIQNAQLRQQTALKNADKVFSLNMAQFNADQQTELSNSKYMQTVSITNANNKQKAVLQNAVLMSQANIAEASLNQQAQIQNAKTFLAMDMQNLSNEQQSNVLQSQQEQQRILSNQAATNAAKQFNAASQNQTDQFMAGLNTQVEQFNAQQNNAAEQFNVQQNNAAEARRVGIEADINKANAAIVNQTKQFNEQIDFNREQFNTQNSLAIQQSNVEWRRRTNLADTAAQNAINQENAKMAFGMTSAAQSFLWQELRDQADYNFRWANDTATRKVQAMIAAAGAEGDVAKNWQSNFNNISRVIDRIIPKD